MPKYRTEHDPEVIDIVERTAQAACATLDEVFGASESAGIGTQFQGVLVEVLRAMLKGQDPLAQYRGHQAFLPQLVVGDQFVGNPCQRGDAFLVVQPTADGTLQALDDHGRLMQMHRVDDAFASFDSAAQHAHRVIKDEGLMIEAARALQLQVVAVVPDPVRESGYIVQSR